MENANETDRARLVQWPVLPMFRSPDALAEQVSQALLGEAVRELRGRDLWRLIRTPDGYEGWATASGLTEPPAGWQGPWAEVGDLWANFRARVDFRMAAAHQAPVGARLPLVAEEEGWAQLLFPDGRRLWTESHRVLVVGDGPLRPGDSRSVCRTARRFLGVPYLWGGRAPTGVDCSGFVQTVLGLHGIPLMRDAHQQSAQGERVREPEAADLVFFATGSQSDQISHVGMMLDRRRFIHAAGSDRVRINRLAEEPYQSQYRLVRRLVPR